MMKKIFNITLATLMLTSAANAQSPLGAASWTWMKGSDSINKNGVYGTVGIPDPLNNPGARRGVGSWTDTAGNFWLFGGEGRPETGTANRHLNDLWKYDPVTNEWTWIKGETTGNNWGVYGTKGTPNIANTPGSRTETATLRDGNGDFWLFAGRGRVASGGTTSELNDLWKYTVSTNEWTWVSGDNLHNQFGVYGTKGVPDVNNKPGTRQQAVSWIDSAGKLWFFGGNGRAANTSGQLNDLWKFDPLTNEWTWMHGDDIAAAFSVYGAKGISAPENKPSARRNSATWTDAEGNFWLFGGQGMARNESTNFNAYLNDLWRYNPNSNEWTWVSGDTTSGNFSEYGELLVSDPINKPGARAAATMWQGPDGYFWLFGGTGFASYLPTPPGPFPPSLSGYLNDLWLYDIAKDEWTWVGGDTVRAENGVYGTQGVTDPDNKPGARYLGEGQWKDSLGNLWMFGGMGYTAQTNADYLNDLWRLEVCFLIGETAELIGEDSVCYNQTYTFRTEEAAHADSYIWTLPAGWTGTSISNEITVITGDAGGTISVQAVSHCDTGTIQSFDVFVDYDPVHISVEEFVLGTSSSYSSYQWFLNGEPIPDATDSTYTVLENGDYTVVVRNATGCIDTSDIYEVTNVPSRIDEFNEIAAQVKMYPNPAHDFINVLAPFKVHATLTNMEGKVLLKIKNATQINLSDLAEGIYLLRITDNNKNLLKTEKVIKL